MRQILSSRSVFTVVGLSAVVMLSGCNGSADSKAKSSSDFVTDSITADYSVTAEENVAKGGADYIIDASFKHGSDTLKLDGGDTAVALNGSQSYSLTENQVFNSVIYRANVYIKDAPANLTFKLNRTKQTVSDLSVVPVPAAFDISMPSAKQTAVLVNKRLLQVRWSNNGGNTKDMEIQHRYRCRVQSQGEALDRGVKTMTADDGAFDIDVVAAIGNATYDSCSIDLVLRRHRVGTLDSALKSGSTNGYFVTRASEIEVLKPGQ